MTGEPSWLPDPTGRHQHRWFDGRAFTDRVADDGATSIDPGPPAAASPGPRAATVGTTSGWAPPGPTTPSWGPAWSPAPAPIPPAPRSRAPLVLALVGTLLVLAGGLAVLLGRGGGGGAGTFDGAVDEGSPLGTHDVALAAGDVLLVTLRPGDDLDAVLGVLVDDDAADALDDTYGDLQVLDRQPGEDGLAVDADDVGDRDQLLLRTDIGFSGEDETLLLAVADDVDVTVVVAPFDPADDADAYEITIEVVALDVDEGADGEELLDAVEEADEVPAPFRDLAEELLGG